MAVSKRKMWLTICLAIVALMIIGPVLAMYILAATATRPATTVIDGRLPPCPDSPNCVCSCDSDDEHAIEPFEYSGDGAEAMKTLQGIAASLPRTNVVSSETDHVHVEVRSAVFRFPDDLEFSLEESNHVIHVRSASRIGHSDLGVNRKRIEAIRAEFQKSPFASQK